MPTTPQNAAGWRTDPPVSDPNAASTAPVATSAADPPDDPPGTRAASIGWWTRPNAEYSVEEPMANSSRFALQAIIPPAARICRIAVASYGERYPSSILEPQVVGYSRVQMLSLTPIVSPA